MPRSTACRQTSIHAGHDAAQIIEQRVAAGLYPGRTVDERAADDAGAHRTQDRQRGDQPAQARSGAVRLDQSARRGRLGRHASTTSPSARHSTRSLPRQNELLKEREEELGAQNERFDAALNNMSQGLCLFDAEQRVVVCQPPLRRDVRLDARAGEARHDAAPDPASACAARGVYGKMTRPNTFARASRRFDRGYRSRRRSWQTAAMHRVVRRPMPDGGLVSTHEDITEREQLNARLEQQHRAAQGAGGAAAGRRTCSSTRRSTTWCRAWPCSTPSSGWSICNQRYAEMYGLSPEQVKPGTSLREILRAPHRQRRASTARARPRSWQVDARAHRRQASRRSTSASSDDGRSIAVSAQPMADGGTVTTHQDITEQRRSEAKIAHMALHDTLTDLPNRVLLNERLEQALRARQARRDRGRATCSTSTTSRTSTTRWAIPPATSCCSMVAERLRALVRETDTIARMGGDEFAILQVAHRPAGRRHQRWRSASSRW